MVTFLYRHTWVRVERASEGAGIGKSSMAGGIVDSRWSNSAQWLKQLCAHTSTSQCTSKPTAASISKGRYPAQTRRFRPCSTAQRPKSAMRPAPRSHHIDITRAPSYKSKHAPPHLVPVPPWPAAAPAPGGPLTAHTGVWVGPCPLPPPNPAAHSHLDPMQAQCRCV